MNENEIMLGEYKLVLWHSRYSYTYDIYLHNEKVGWVYFLNDTVLSTIYTDDTDLIALLLLKYQPAYDISIYPYKE